MRLLLLLLSLCALLAAAPSATVASQCHGDVTIGKAADAELWRHCTHISGNLRIIETSDLATLNALSALTRVDKDLDLQFNSALESLSGLSQLQSIGGELYLESNARLASLAGLSALQTIGHRLVVHDHDAMTSVAGLDSLQTVGEGGIVISHNHRLPTLSGLLPATFHSLGGPLTILGNSALESLTGLESLRSVSGGSVRIDSNVLLRSLRGLDNLVSIDGGSLLIENNMALDDFTPLVALQRVAPAEAVAHLVVLAPPMPEVRCLPKFVLAHADTNWYSSRGAVPQCEALLQRLREGGYPLTVVALLESLGLERHWPFFQRHNLHPESFLHLFPDSDRPFDSPVVEALWPHLLYDDADRASFRAWLQQQNEALRLRYASREHRHKEEL